MQTYFWFFFIFYTYKNLYKTCCQFAFSPDTHVPLVSAPIACVCEIASLGNRKYWFVLVFFLNILHISHILSTLSRPITSNCYNTVFFLYIIVLLYISLCIFITCVFPSCSSKNLYYFILVDFKTRTHDTRTNTVFFLFTPV